MVMVGRFKDRDIINKPSCPFCGTLIERPREQVFKISTEMPVGLCTCGAVYACDVTGHNLGTAMMDALVFDNQLEYDLKQLVSKFNMRRFFEKDYYPVSLF